MASSEGAGRFGRQVVARVSSVHDLLPFSHSFRALWETLNVYKNALFLNDEFFGKSEVDLFNRNIDSFRTISNQRWISEKYFKRKYDKQ